MNKTEKTSSKLKIKILFINSSSDFWIRYKDINETIDGINTKIIENFNINPPQITKSFEINEIIAEEFLCTILINDTRFRRKNIFMPFFGYW
jgi:hypothetical protein